MFRPSSAIRLADFSLGAWIAWSMVLKLVPASDPSRPADANAARPPVVSSMERPAAEAIRPDWFRAIPRSSTDPIALPAPAASRSATCGRSLPDRLNWVMAVEAMPAASATSICPAAARDSAPFRPPPMMSLADTPAFAISVMASAASVAEKAVSAPAFIAASRNLARSAPEAPVAAEMADMDFSNSIDLATAMPRPATMAPPMMRAPLPAMSKCLDACV
jgi:hypothetical protein